MGLEVSANSGVVCSQCGTQYAKARNNFYACYAPLYKGTGYLSICRKCVEDIYNFYLPFCNDTRKAVRQTCRKLDLYWDDKIFDSVLRRDASKTVMSGYIAALTSRSYVGKSYDDTLAKEGTLWKWEDTTAPEPAEEEQTAPDDDGEEEVSLEGVPKELIAFWGTGFSPSMYYSLDQRYQYWVSRIQKEGKEIDVGTEALLRQICNLEIDINRAQVEGRTIDKNVNVLNTLVGSLNLKPSQQKEEIDSALENTPFGVWIKRWEDERPIPEPDPELQDADGIIKYILVWVFGHLAKMLGIKNTYSKLYDEEIAKFRATHPEYADEEDEVMLGDALEDVDIDKENSYSSDIGDDDESGGDADE